VTSSSAPLALVGDRYWVYLIARAVPAALVAAFITFSADHSVRVGWTALAVLGAATGLIVVTASVRMLRGATGTLLAIQGAALLVGAVIALVASASGVGVFTAVLGAVFGLSGALELVAGIRARGALSVARDWIFLGGLSMVFALAIVFIPVDYSEVITVPGKDVPNLTASVVVVGTLGAHAAIAAVYLVIAGLSLKWAKHPEAVTTVESAP